LLMVFDLEVERLFMAGRFATIDEAFERETAPYRATRGTAGFPLKEPIPYGLIERLVVLLIKQRS
jgi:uncharacterized protein YdhG (YjbR/CyaY superfamily)